MRPRPRPLASGLALATLAVGCSVQDADLDTTAAITGLSFATSDDLPHRRTTVSGTITLGYTADQLVQLRVLDNAAQVHAESLVADRLTLDFTTELELLDPGANELTVEVIYNGQALRQRRLVTVPAALQGFALSPGASAVNVFEAELTGSVQLGFFSAEAATLEILVGGASVHQQSIPASESLSATLDVTVPLARAGSNDVVALVRYEGEELTQRATIAVAMDAPSVVFGAFDSPTFRPHEGLDLSDTLAVVAAPAYSIDSVTYSLEGDPVRSAVDEGGGSYRVDLANPDIGASDLAVTVRTANDGHLQETVFHRTLTVDPIFDCDAPSGAMLPTTELTRNLNSEVRVMSGYFGRVGGGHTVAFALTASATNLPGSPRLTILGSPLAVGSTEQTVQYNVQQLRCQDNGQSSCTESYDLAALVDGVELCARSGFGLVRTFF